MQDTHNFNAVLSRIIKDNVVTDGKTAKIWNQVRPLSPNTRLPTKDFEFFANMQNNTVGCIRVIARNIFFNFLQIALRLRRKPYLSHVFERSRCWFFSRIWASACLPSTNSPRLI